MVEGLECLNLPVQVPAALAERESPPEGTKWTIPDWFREEWPSIAAEAVEEEGGVALDFLQREGETVVVPKGWWVWICDISKDKFSQSQN